MNAELSIASGKRSLERKIKSLLVVFIAALTLSGITAFPIEAELQIADRFVRDLHWENPLTRWLQLAFTGIRETNSRYPFIAYGTDWLAFAHLIFAIAFVGPLREPVKNIWVIEFGLIACLSVVPLALIAGEVRGIPLFWRLLDSLFGIVGGLVLLACYTKIKKLETLIGKR